MPYCIYFEVYVKWSCLFLLCVLMLNAFLRCISMVFKRIILQLLELLLAIIRAFEYEETLSISLFINVTQ